MGGGCTVGLASPRTKNGAKADGLIDILNFNITGGALLA